ncbi:hypothetical protein TBK1r_75250 [Stieleria magnilauensis]|uniref:DUF1963 domain-containing protein n=2 Tax=Stieleria magnilauensis TaxID=2527963 RepID=A0ABX5Y2J4_9BACT|nr:hypothetical protein TBK1r_75250 [Planctomycetes bacterium TBK1r]
MFQVAFPDVCVWERMTLACFVCMRCADERFLIPEMLREHQRGADIPGGFLSLYQRNFRFIVFPTLQAQKVDDYVEETEFYSLQFSDNSDRFDFGKIGGKPSWLLEDETPATYDSSTPMEFLMELVPGLQFSVVDGASPQVELDIFGMPSPSPLEYYQLFLGNSIYLFGTKDGEPLVYAITQT